MLRNPLYCVLSLGPPKRKESVGHTDAMFLGKLKIIFAAVHRLHITNPKFNEGEMTLK